MNRTKSIYLALVAVLLSPMAANAVSVVISGQCINDSERECAFGIDGLALSSGTFDIEFVLDSYNGTYGLDTPLFFGDSAGATEAANAITGLLDSLFYGPHGNGTEFVDAVVVPTEFGTTGTVRGFCAGTGPLTGGSPAWESSPCSAGADAVYANNFYWAWARFTPTSVPEPGTLTLLGLGLAGIGFARRKKA